MAMTELTLVSAFLIGLLGSTHCLGMCGGFAAAIGHGQASPLRVLVYNGGRLLTYGLIGALAGFAGAQVVQAAPQLSLVLRTVAGLLLIAMGLYVSQWWMGLTRLEILGTVIWRRVQPLTRGLIPIRHHWQALVVGALWGLLPCGLVYSTVSWAVATADWRDSALLMVAFGIGTLPAMMGVGFVNQAVLKRWRQGWVRQLAGSLIFVMGLWTIAMPWLHAGHGQSGDAGAMQEMHHH